MTMERTIRKRSCIACGKDDGKSNLIRFVRGADGSVNYDETGKVPGRGAYVCSQDCLEKALKTKKLDRALRASLDESDRSRLSTCLGCSNGATS